MQWFCKDSWKIPTDSHVSDTIWMSVTALTIEEEKQLNQWCQRCYFPFSSLVLIQRGGGDTQERRAEEMKRRCWFCCPPVAGQPQLKSRELSSIKELSPFHFTGLTNAIPEPNCNALSSAWNVIKGLARDTWCNSFRIQEHRETKTLPLCGHCWVRLLSTTGLAFPVPGQLCFCLLLWSAFGFQARQLNMLFPLLGRLFPVCEKDCLLSFLRICIKCYSLRELFPSSWTLPSLCTLSHFHTHVSILFVSFWKQSFCSTLSCSRLVPNKHIEACINYKLLGWWLRLLIG